MPDLKKMRRGLIIAIGALLVVDLVAAALLMTPWAGRENLRQAELRQLWSNLKARQSAPWRGLDKKIPEARKQVESFNRDRFPAGYSEISTTLGRIASQTGVKLSSDRYSQSESDLTNLPRVDVEADISGDYLALVRFINAVERSKLFFIVDELDLAGEQTGTVRLRIKVETYLRAI